MVELGFLEGQTVGCRAAPREYVNEAGLIAVYEPNSIGGNNYDWSNRGVRLTMPGTYGVPAMCLPSSHCDTLRVCRTVGRIPEEIGATFTT